MVDNCSTIELEPQVSVLNCYDLEKSLLSLSFFMVGMLVLSKRV